MRNVARWMSLVVFMEVVIVTGCNEDYGSTLPPVATATATPAVATAAALTPTLPEPPPATMTEQPARTTTPVPPLPTMTERPARTATPVSSPPTATPVCSITPGALPFERTECRATCQNYDPLKQPFFGETHLHTAYSFDASTLDTRNLPPDAYRYAKGGMVGLPPWADTRGGTPTPGYMGPTEVTAFPYCLPGEECQYSATRSAQLPPGRALDFAAVTDHSEQFGENNICLFEGTEPCTSDGDCTMPGQVCSAPDIGPIQGSGVCVPNGYNDRLCKDARLGLSRLRSSPIAAYIAGFENVSENPARPPELCGPDGEACRSQARLVWQQIINAAQAAYDHTPACTFTSFIAYEYTAMATNGRCSSDLLPCWEAQDCSGQQTCDTDFLGSTGGTTCIATSSSATMTSSSCRSATSRSLSLAAATRPRATPWARWRRRRTCSARSMKCVRITPSIRAAMSCPSHTTRT